MVVAGRARRLLLCALGLAALMLAAAVGCGGEPAPSVAEQLDQVADAVTPPLVRLSSATRAARPSDRESMVTLRATAGRAGDVLAMARRDLRDVEASSEGGERADVRDLGSALDEYLTLSDELGASRLSVPAIEVAAERARQAGRDAGVSLPSIDASELVAAVRRQRRQRQTAGRPSEPVGDGNPPGSSIAYRSYTGPAFQAQVPTGPGWAEPSQSQPTPGRLFRTNVRGPEGLFVIIDFTPFEPAGFGGRYESRTEVGQTAFGSATRYVFTGGRLPECQRSTCVDYIINGGGTEGGSGFAVLAGGDDAATTGQIAQMVAESVTPIGQYDE